MPKLLLNAVSIGVGAAVEVVAGVHAYDKDALDTLRQKHRGDYLFRRSGEDGKTVYSVALKADLPVLTERSERFRLSLAPWLLAPLTLEALLHCFVRLQRPVLKARHPLRVLSQKPLNLFPDAAGLPPWLQRRIVLEFDTRIVKENADKAGAMSRSPLNA